MNAKPLTEQAREFVREQRGPGGHHAAADLVERLLAERALQSSPSQAMREARLVSALEHIGGDERPDHDRNCDCPACIAHAVLASPPVEGEGLGEEALCALVDEVMLDTWNDICTDTDCHPLDIEQGRAGKSRRRTGRLHFQPRHWARAIAMHLAARLSTPKAERGQPSEQAKIMRAYRKWQDAPHDHVPDDEDHKLLEQAFAGGWHARDKLVARLIQDVDEEMERADEAAALSAQPSEAVREAVSGWLRREAADYRISQEAAKSPTDKVYRMGQKDALLVAADQVLSLDFAALKTSPSANGEAE